jgi:outer membrane protein TolC
VAVQRELEAQQAWHALLPALSAQGDLLRNQYLAQATLPSGAGGGSNTATFTPLNQYDLTLTATVPILDLSRWNTIAVAKRNREVQDAHVGATEFDVAKSVATTYYQLLGANAVVLSAKRTQTAAEDNAKYLTDRNGAGFTSDLDVLRARAEVERDRQAIADAEYTRATLARSLETLTGVAVGPSLVDAVPLDDLHDEAPLEAWLSSVGGVPAVAEARAAAHAQDAIASQQRATLLPTISAQATERFTNAIGFGISPYYTVGLVASWKLDLGTYTGARATDAAAQAAEVRAERSSATARDAIYDAWQQVRSQIAKCRAARAQRDASKQTVAVAAQKYGAGTATLLDVIQAQRDDFTAEVTSLQADADLASARASLRLASGRVLFSGGTR